MLAGSVSAPFRRAHLLEQPALRVRVHSCLIDKRLKARILSQSSQCRLSNRGTRARGALSPFFSSSSNRSKAARVDASALRCSPIDLRTRGAKEEGARRTMHGLCRSRSYGTSSPLEFRFIVSRTSSPSSS